MSAPAAGVQAPNPGVPAAPAAAPPLAAPAALPPLPKPPFALPPVLELAPAEPPLTLLPPLAQPHRRWWYPPRLLRHPACCWSRRGLAPRASCCVGRQRGSTAEVRLERSGGACSGNILASAILASDRRHFLRP